MIVLLAHRPPLTINWLCSTTGIPHGQLFSHIIQADHKHQGVDIRRVMLVPEKSKDGGERQRENIKTWLGE